VKKVVAKASRGSSASLKELLAFERLLSDLSARFANVAGEQVISEIKIALGQLLEFLDFDRSNFAEFTYEGKQNLLCAVAVEGVKPLSPGPIPAFLGWFVGELLRGRTVIIRSYEDFPAEAAAAAEYYRGIGIRSQLAIPLSVGGRIVAAIGFGSFRDTQNWPEEFIARVKVIGEVMAQALVRKRSETALRASEERWRSIFQTATLAITVFDQDLHYVATNPAFQALLGYTGDELRLLTPLDITVDEERETAKARLADLRQGKIDHYMIEKQYRRKDGKVIWAQASVARASQSGPLTFIGTMIDITDSKRAKDSLLETQSELARVAQLTTIGQMAASIAHEINQPLTSIIVASDASLRWLAKKPPNLAEVRGSIKRIADAGHRAHQVVDGIRSMFQKDSQRREMVDVNQVIREMLDLVHEEAQKKQIIVRSNLREGMRPVLANRIQLQQVVLNLITNAIEAMVAVTDGHRVLQVTSKLSEPDDVLITVEDTGPGVDPKDANRIFDPFFTTKSQGMGMGLAICRAIVEAHGGRLSARSAADRGSVFEIALAA